MSSIRKIQMLCVTAILAVLTAFSALAVGPPHLWSARFGEPCFGDHCDQFVKSLAVDNSGNVVIVGPFYGLVNFGGDLLQGGHGYFDSHIFVAKFDSNGNHVWSTEFSGTSGDNTASSVDTDDLGNIVVTGAVYGDIDFGGGVLGGHMGNSFLVKFDKDGNHVWSQRFAGTGFDNSIDIDDSGTILFAGSFSDSVNLGGGELISAGGQDVFVAKFDECGDHIWSKRLGGLEHQCRPSVFVDDAGNVLITGSFAGTIDCGGGPLASAGSYDIFLAKLDAGGDHLWSQRFGDANYEMPRSVVVDGLGNVGITGFFTGNVNFGGGELVSAGDYDMFLAKFDPTGEHLWSQRFGDSSSQISTDLAVDGIDNIILYGQGGGTVDFGGGGLVSAGGYDIFIAEFDASGDHMWSQQFGQSGYPSARSIAVDGSSGSIFFTGELSDTLNFGGEPLISAGGKDIYLVKLGPNVVGIRDRIAAPALDIRMFPNPFNPATTITFTIPRQMRTHLMVYDVQGKLVTVLVDEKLSAGPHEVSWNGRDSSGNIVGSGIYFCRLQAEGESVTRKTVFLK